MAKMVQIRNVPDDVHARLRQRAAAAGMSMSSFLLREIRQVADRPSLDEILARAARRVAGQLTVDQVVDAVHTSRAEREEQLMVAVEAPRRKRG